MAKAKSVPMSQQIAWLVINRDRLNAERNNGKAIRQQMAKHFKNVGEVMSITSLYARLQELDIQYKDTRIRTPDSEVEYVTLAAYRCSNTRVNYDALDVASALDRISDALEALSVDSRNDSVGQVLAETSEQVRLLASAIHDRVPNRAIRARAERLAKAEEEQRELGLLFSPPTMAAAGKKM